MALSPILNSIDTLAAEYPAVTNYLYLTYSGSENDIERGNDNKSIIVLGSGAYRIDRASNLTGVRLNAISTIRKEGFRSVMIIIIPKQSAPIMIYATGSISIELTFERVMDIIDFEKPRE